MNRPDLTELTAHCIRCGFCLESCPTFKIDQDESESPRGRIYLIRSAMEGKLAWEDIRGPVDTCLGCVACQTACPSGVEYGAILELAREKMGVNQGSRFLLKGLTHPKSAALQFKAGALLPGGKLPGPISRMLFGAAQEARLPKPQVSRWPDMPESAFPPVKGEVALILGCVMRVLYPGVHEATRRLLRRVGLRAIEIDAPCCGALDAHSGQLDAAREKALELVKSIPADIPIVVNSAGCGSTMKHYGFLDEALDPVARRVCDLSEVLYQSGLLEALRGSLGLKVRATYHDACHLAHGQKVTAEPRALLSAIPGLDLRPLTEADTCCGSAGIYNVQQPRRARDLVERKIGFIEQTGAEIAVTGNPGCHAWIHQAATEHGGKIRVLHTAEVLEAAFIGALPPPSGSS